MGAFQHFISKMDSTLSLFGRYYSKNCGGGRAVLDPSKNNRFPTSSPANLSRVCHKFIPPFNIDSTQILSWPAGNNYLNGRQHFQFAANVIKNVFLFYKLYSDAEYKKCLNFLYCPFCILMQCSLWKSFVYRQ